MTIYKTDFDNEWTTYKTPLAATQERLIYHIYHKKYRTLCGIPTTPHWKYSAGIPPEFGILLSPCKRCQKIQQGNTKSVSI